MQSFPQQDPLQHPESEDEILKIWVKKIKSKEDSFSLLNTQTLVNIYSNLQLTHFIILHPQIIFKVLKFTDNSLPPTLGRIPMHYVSKSIPSFGAL